MSAMSTVWRVARREIKARFLTKANIISLSIMFVVVVAGIMVMDYFINRDVEPAAIEIAVDEQTADLQASLESAAAGQNLTVEVTTSTREEAEDALAEELDGFLTGNPASPELVVQEQADTELLGLVTGAVQSYALGQQITELGGDPSQVGQVLAQAAPNVTSVISEDAENEQFGPTYFVAILSISVLLFALIGTGSLIAMGVVEEKTSRVVEILLATIRPSHLLAGKILGIGIVGLIQVVVLGGAAIGSIAVTGLMAGFSIDLSAAMLLMLLWFILGFAIFALLFGGFAALVSRQEDIGSVTTPLMFLLFIPYYLSMFLVSNDPDSSLVQVLSQIPFFSPFMMPMRSAYDGVTSGELLLSVALAMVTVPLLVWVASKVYHRGVLHTGGRMKLSEAFGRS